MENKWSGLEDESYHLENLGRPAIFLLPVRKLQKELGGVSVEQLLHQFLIAEFESYTSSTIPSFGVWKDAQKTIISDECRQYEVSFAGKERIPVLAKKLAEIAKWVEEECIYLKAGQYSCLVYPAASQKPH